MTEIQALHAVRAKFEHAVPEIVEWGVVQCFDSGNPVARLVRQQDGSWDVVWGEMKAPAAPMQIPPAVPPIAEAKVPASSPPLEEK
jgi:hypothetical protein